MTISSTASKNKKNLREFTKEAVNQYLTTLDHCETANLYANVLQQVEMALFETVLRKTKNQSKAARLLGISRVTLRKKIKQYDINLH